MAQGLEPESWETRQGTFPRQGHGRSLIPHAPGSRLPHSRPGPETPSMQPPVSHTTLFWISWNPPCASSPGFLLPPADSAGPSGRCRSEREHLSMMISTPSCFFFIQILGFLYIIFSRVIYLFEGQTAPICWFNPQIPAPARAGPGWSREPGTQCGCLTWVAGTQLVEPSPLPPRVCVGRKLEQGTWASRSSALACCCFVSATYSVTCCPELPGACRYLLFCGLVSICKFTFLLPKTSGTQVLVPMRTDSQP